MSQLVPPNTNIRSLAPKILRLIAEDLDLGSKWRDLIECADGTKYELSINEVEECGRVLHQSLSASPSEKLLLKWGMWGMTVYELAQFLDKLRMERVLVYIRPPEELVITQQPVSELTVEEGDTLIVTCEASGFPYPVYAWFRGDNKLSLRQDGKLVIDKASLSDSGNYTCRIHHKVNSETPYVFTTWCTVLVKPRPATFCEPEPESYQFSPVVDQKLPYYIPKKNGSVNPLKLQKTTIYSNKGTFEKSLPVVNTDTQVMEPPTILVQPTSRSDSIGGQTLFFVKAIHAYETVYYQWYHNSLPIEGATSNEVRIEIHGIDCAGDYQVRVYTRSHGGILSKVATLTVNEIPNVYTAGDKVALVIGISTYRSFGQPLPAVEHDLYSTVKVFTDMKFKVISLLDLTLTEMVNAVNEFCNMLSPEVYAVFYCAGHGFIFNNQHYLIPWDARQGTDLRESLCIETVEAKIQMKKPKMLLMFLDICRKSVEHLNPMNMPLIHVPVKSSNANKITIYAASVGEQSFEESQKPTKDPRGIFNQYLLEVLEKKNLNAFQVFEALQTKFKDCRYNRQRYPQHPEMTINLEESRRSLWDPVDPDKHRAIAQMRKRSWEDMNTLPPNFSVKVNESDSIRLSFCKVASNVMDMIAVPNLASGCKVHLVLPKDRMDPILQPITISRLQSNPNATKFRFPNLQRLQSKLLLHMLIQLYNSNSASDIVDTKVCTIDLGRPLISYCSLGEVKQLAQVERKEPMEHSESATPLPEKQP